MPTAKDTNLKRPSAAPAMCAARTRANRGKFLPRTCFNPAEDVLHLGNKLIERDQPENFNDWLNGKLRQIILQEAQP